ncbi:MAG: hypothetical protein FWH17_03730 [Oscillospiraceae bacterium]|nr:hypothetical protein [Oscillospiraceae bacterium]
MKSRNGIISIGIIGAIVLALTLAAFFLLGIEKSTVNIWALSFLLLSICALFGGLIWLRFAGSQHSKVFLKLGVTTALTLYFGVTFASVFFAGLLKEKLNTFILMELSIIALFAIIIVAILAFSRRVARRNEIDTAKVGSNEPKRGGF